MSKSKIKQFRRKLKASGLLEEVARQKGDISAILPVLKTFEAEVMPAIGLQTRILAETLGDFEPRVQCYANSGDEDGWCLVEVLSGNPRNNPVGYQGVLQNIRDFITHEVLGTEFLAVWQFPFQSPLDEHLGACLISHRLGSTIYILEGSEMRCLATGTEVSEGAVGDLMSRFKPFRSVQALTAPSLAKRIRADKESFDAALAAQGVDPSAVPATVLEACVYAVAMDGQTAAAITGYVQAVTERLLEESHNATLAMAGMVQMQTSAHEQHEKELRRATEQAKLRISKGYQTQLDNAKRILEGAQARSRRLEQELAELRKSGGAKALAPAEVKDPVARALGAYFS